MIVTTTTEPNETKKNPLTDDLANSFFFFVLRGRKCPRPSQDPPKKGKTARGGRLQHIHASRPTTPTATPTPTAWLLVVLSRISDNASSVISSSEVSR